MKLIPTDKALRSIDCHIHSRFSPDARDCGADEPQAIADAVRKKGLDGFIITDHLDIGHWNGYIIDFDRYFSTWERVRSDNPDLKIVIGLEIGYERIYYKKTRQIVKDLPLEYVINSVHYWERGASDEPPFLSYLDAVERSLDVDYEFSAVGHLGFLERYTDAEMRYADYKPVLDRIIKAAVSRGVMFEENTNSGGEMRLPRKEFLQAYKAAGGVRPVLGSDAHESSSIGQHFDKAKKFLDGIFGE